MSGGPITVANAWADILFRSDADTTSDKWSKRNTKVACSTLQQNTRIRKNMFLFSFKYIFAFIEKLRTLLALGRQSRMLSISLAFPSGSSGRHTAGNCIILHSFINLNVYIFIKFFIRIRIRIQIIYLLLLLYYLEHQRSSGRDIL